MGQAKQRDIDDLLAEKASLEERLESDLAAQKVRLEKDWGAALNLKQREIEGMRTQWFAEVARLRNDIAAEAKKGAEALKAAEAKAAKEAEDFRAVIAGRDEQLEQAARDRVEAAAAADARVQAVRDEVTACEAVIAEREASIADLEEQLRVSRAETAAMTADRDRVKAHLVDAMKMEDANFRLEKQLLKARREVAEKKIASRLFVQLERSGSPLPLPRHPPRAGPS